MNGMHVVSYDAFLSADVSQGRSHKASRCTSLCTRYAAGHLCQYKARVNFEDKGQVVEAFKKGNFNR